MSSSSSKIMLNGLRRTALTRSVTVLPAQLSKGFAPAVGSSLYIASGNLGSANANGVSGNGVNSGRGVLTGVTGQGRSFATATAEDFANANFASQDANKSKEKNNENPSGNGGNGGAEGEEGKAEGSFKLKVSYWIV